MSVAWFRPRGLTAEPSSANLDPAKDRRIDAPLAAAIHEAVWSVVRRHPLAGVAQGQAGDPGPSRERP